MTFCQKVTAHASHMDVPLRSGRLAGGACSTYSSRKLSCHTSPSSAPSCVPSAGSSSWVSSTEPLPAMKACRTECANETHQLLHLVPSCITWHCLCKVSSHDLAHLTRCGEGVDVLAQLVDDGVAAPRRPCRSRLMGCCRRLGRISSQVLLAVQHHYRPLLVHLQKVLLVSTYIWMTEELLDMYVP